MKLNLNQFITPLIFVLILTACLPEKKSQSSKTGETTDRVVTDNTSGNTTSGDEDFEEGSVTGYYSSGSSVNGEASGTVGTTASGTVGGTVGSSTSGQTTGQSGTSTGGQTGGGANLSQGELNYKEVLDWYRAVDSTAVSTHVAYTELTSSTDISSTKPICGENDFSISKPCIKATSCFIAKSSGVTKGKATFDTVHGKEYMGCSMKLPSLYKKHEDVKLKEYILGKANRFLLVEKTKKVGSIYYLYYAPFEGSLSIIETVEINTSLPAILNPLARQEKVNNAIVYSKKVFRFF